MTKHSAETGTDAGERAKTVPVITIDGPGGAGKGTLSVLLAKALNWQLLDSGAMYRLLALLCKQRSVSPNDATLLSKLASDMDVRFLSPSDVDIIGLQATILLQGKDVTDSIRTEAVGSTASQIAKLASVRQALLDRQRAFQIAPGLVADGRDMGTVVFPDAPLKIFLTASAEERAKRRYKQLKEKGESVSLAPLLKDIKVRDERDMTRSIAPLRPADDAILLDSTTLSIEKVLEKVIVEANKRALASC